MKARDKDPARAAAWTSIAAAATGGAVTAGVGEAATARREFGLGDAVLAPPLDPDAEPRGNLRRYLKWQLEDFARERGSWIVGIGVLVVALARAYYRPQDVTASPALPPTAIAAHVSERARFLQQLLNAFVPLSFAGTLFSTHGIVSRDRERGFQRFLFAKPLRATRYYLQTFLVNGIGYLGALALLLAFAAASFARGVPVSGGFVVACATYATFGGLVLLLSTLTRRDVAWTLALSFVAAFLSQNERVLHFGSWTWWEIFSWLLPPVDSLGGATEALAHDGSALRILAYCAWPFAYGAACLAAGLTIIRRRSIGN